MSHTIRAYTNKFYKHPKTHQEMAYNIAAVIELNYYNIIPRNRIKTRQHLTTAWKDKTLAAYYEYYKIFAA